MWGSAEPEAIHRAPVAPASLTSRFVSAVPYASDIFALGASLDALG